MAVDEITRITLNTDILIIGGGAAGCQAAIHAKELNPLVDVLVVDKAGIERSGCLAAGVNAINAHLNEGETPESFTEYVKKDSAGLIREDLTMTIGKRLNKMTSRLEGYGLYIYKDEKGNYIPRGRGSIKIEGENIKPVIANAVRKSGARVLEKVNAVELILNNGRAAGLYAFSVNEEKFYIINAKAVIIATGGASGIYSPNNEGASRHKMWYSPFNTGAGFYMGMAAGAEMTTFEMRFIALRIKDVISPTGTVAQGVAAPQINALGEKYMQKYTDKSTPGRLYATLKENEEGRGPCYLDITGVPDEGNIELKKAYLSMSPGIVLKWADEGIEPNERPLEICGSEPYIVGGHGQAGYWVDINRRTTVAGLYAAGDAAGGAPKKYVTGAMAEGEIAVEDALKYIENITISSERDTILEDKKIDEILEPLMPGHGVSAFRDMELRLQKIMDEYAGGIKVNYGVSETKLLIAREKLKLLWSDINGELKLKADSMRELLLCREVIERIVTARAVVEHLLHRKETRWKCYQQRLDYPERDDIRWLKFVNSKYNNNTGEIAITERVSAGGEFSWE